MSVYSIFLMIRLILICKQKFRKICIEPSYCVRMIDSLHKISRLNDRCR